MHSSNQRGQNISVIIHMQINHFASLYFNEQSISTAKAMLLESNEFSNSAIFPCRLQRLPTVSKIPLSFLKNSRHWYQKFLSYFVQGCWFFMNCFKKLDRVMRTTVASKFRSIDQDCQSWE